MTRRAVLRRALAAPVLVWSAPALTTIPATPAHAVSPPPSPPTDTPGSSQDVLPRDVRRGTPGQPGTPARHGTPVRRGTGDPPAVDTTEVLGALPRTGANATLLAGVGTAAVAAGTAAVKAAKADKAETD